MVIFKRYFYAIKCKEFQLFYKSYFQHVAFFREILKSRVFLTIHAILESKVTLKGNFKRHEEVFDALRQLKARSRNLLAESKLIMHK